MPRAMLNQYTIAVATLLCTRVGSSQEQSVTVQ